MSWRAISPDQLADEVADWLVTTERAVRVAVDGALCTHPADLAERLVEPLRLRGRPVVLIDARSFWHDASLRLEHGREDVESYGTWLDADALAREVLDPIVTDLTYLPSLRDPRTNRSTRETRQAAAPDSVVLVSGELLLGRGLPFDKTIHLAMSPAARARHTPPDRAWTLPAFERYDAEVDPRRTADVVVTLDDPARPAVRGLPAVP